MVHILYYNEMNLQLRAKMTHSSQIGKYAPDERIRGIFASAESLPTSATLPLELQAKGKWKWWHFPNATIQEPNVQI